MKIRKFEVALAVGLAVAIAVSLSPGAEGIDRKVIRLHVLANSDGECDQQLKLMVRDRVLEVVGRLTEADSIDEAQAKLCDNLELIRAEALAEVRKQGYDYDVSVTLGKEYYETRDYDSFSLPAGEYSSLKVTIGAGEGHNWWCVVFPPLCMAAVSEEITVQTSGLSRQDVALITKDGAVYVFKFKVLELLGELKHCWE